MKRLQKQKNIFFRYNVYLKLETIEIFVPYSIVNALIPTRYTKETNANLSIFLFPALIFTQAKNPGVN